MPNPQKGGDGDDNGGVINPTPQPNTPTENE